MENCQVSEGKEEQYNPFIGQGSHKLLTKNRSQIMNTVLTTAANALKHNIRMHGYICCPPAKKSFFALSSASKNIPALFYDRKSLQHITIQLLY